MHAKSTKFFSLHSMLAPRSRTTFMPRLFGHKPANAGLLIPLIDFNKSREISKSAPVFPAEREISVLFSF